MGVIEVEPGWRSFRRARATSCSPARVGRLGVMIDNHPEIFPVNYAR